MGGVPLSWTRGGGANPPTCPYIIAWGRLRQGHTKTTGASLVRLGASSQSGSDSASEAVNGIVQGHAYSILKACGRLGGLSVGGAWETPSPSNHCLFRELTTRRAMCKPTGEESQKRGRDDFFLTAKPPKFICCYFT